MTSAINITHGANDPSNWTSPNETVSGKLDELASRNASAALGFSGANLTLSAGATLYLGNNGHGTSTAANNNYYFPRAGNIRNLRVYISANGSTGAGNTCTAYHNNSLDTTLQVSYGAGATGLLADTAGSIEVSAGDTITWKFLHNDSGFGAGAITVQSLSFEFYGE